MRWRFLWVILVVAAVVLASRGLSAGDVQLFGVVKLHEFTQELTGAPVPAPGAPYSFQALVVATTNGSVTAATVKPPGSTPTRSLESVTNGQAFAYSERFASSSALDDAYPSRGGLFNPSVYTFTVRTDQAGEQRSSVSFLGVLVAPPAVEVTPLEGLQAVDTTRELILSWKAPGATFLDLAQVAIVDAATNVVFASPPPLTNGALTGLDTEVRIPPDTLTAGAALTGHVILARPGLPNTNGLSGAIGVAAVAMDTRFPVVTRPLPAPPRLAVLSGRALPVELEVTADTNRVLHLQGSADWRTWEDLLVTNVSTGTLTHTDAASLRLPHRMYRVRVGP